MSFKLSIGKCAIAGKDLYTNEAIVSFYSNDETKLLNKYLYYVLSTRDYTNAGKGSLGNGSMNKKSLAEMMIAIPPLNIQNKIIDILDQKYKEREEALKIVKETESIAKSIIQSYIDSMGSSTMEKSKKEPKNEINNPEEVSLSAVVASTESSVKKVVKRKTPVVAKPLGDAGLDVITHEE